MHRTLIVLLGSLSLAAQPAPDKGDPKGVAGPVAYLRFEEGRGNKILDAVSQTVHGTHSATYSSDVPAIGVDNKFSLVFRDNKIATILKPFIFNASVGEGSRPSDSKDATIEFWIKPLRIPSQTAIFWTGRERTDSNRFHLYLEPDFMMGMDYRSQTGQISGLNNTLYIPPKEWTHVAIVRKGRGYEYYRNAKYLFRGEDGLKSLPSGTTWRINGRNAEQQVFLLDEVRIWDRAVGPSDFLVPSTMKPDPQDPKAQQVTVDFSAEALRTRFAGKATYDTASETFKISYDFSSKDQINDFASLKTPVRITNNVVKMEPGQVLQHRTKFKTLQVSVRCRNNGKNQYFRTSSGTLFLTYSDTTALRCAEMTGERFEVTAQRLPAGKIWTAEMQLVENRASLRVSDVEMSRDARQELPGYIQLLGGDRGNTFQSLTLEGKLDPQWVRSFLGH